MGMNSCLVELGHVEFSVTFWWLYPRVVRHYPPLYPTQYEDIVTGNNERNFTSTTTDKTHIKQI